VSRPRRGLALPALALAALLSGCSDGGVETTYGRMRGQSVNGTGVLAELFRRQGHTVRAASRLNEKTAGQADLIVRFALRPGPPDREEADWFDEWLSDYPGRRLIYVVRDFNGEPEYWSGALDRLPEDASEERRSRMEARRDAARTWPLELPAAPKEVADPVEWFAMEEGVGSTTVCRTLGGPWAEGVDAASAALFIHHAFRQDDESGNAVLLEGEGKPLVVTWHWAGDSEVLAVANGSFLLNEALVPKGRRPLAQRVVRWAGESPLRVVFAEGSGLLSEGESSRSPFALLWVPPLGWIAVHMMAFGLIACLARAAILGRPRVEPPSGADRPAAHAEALGALLARTRDVDAARSLLETYRRWRHASAGAPRPRGTKL
jgi:hypothetical protein